MSKIPTVVFAKSTEIITEFYQPTKPISDLYHLLLNENLDPNAIVTFEKTNLRSLIETLGADATKLYQELISPEHKHEFQTVHQLRQLFLTLLTSYNVDPILGVANLNLQGLLTGTKKQPNVLDTASYTKLINRLTTLVGNVESNPAFKQKTSKNPHPVFTNMQYQLAYPLFVQENNIEQDEDIEELNSETIQHSAIDISSENIQPNLPLTQPILLSHAQRNQFAIDEYIARYLAYCTFKDNDIVRVHQYDSQGECSPVLYRVKNIVTSEKGIKGIALIPVSQKDSNTIHIAFPGVNMQNPETVSVAMAPASAPGHQSYKKVEDDILNVVNQIIADYHAADISPSNQTKPILTPKTLHLNLVGHSLGGALAQKIFTSTLLAEEANSSLTGTVLNPADNLLDDSSMKKLSKSRAHHSSKPYKHIHSGNISSLQLSTFATAGLTLGSASRADYLLRAMEARGNNKLKIEVNHFKSSHDPVNTTGSSVIGFGIGLPKSENANISAHSYTINEHNMGPKHTAIDAHSLPFFARETQIELTKHRSNEPDDVEHTNLTRKLSGFLHSRKSSL